MTRSVLHYRPLIRLYLGLWLSFGGSMAIADLARSAESPVAEPSASAVDGRLTFTGPDGQPLYFVNDAAVVDFLQTAEIVSTEEIPAGVNRPLKLLLAKDGVQMNAVLRTVDKSQREYQAPNRVILKFHDSYLFEPAAYRLSRLLGLDAVPPAVVRQLGKGRTGSLQVWLEETITDRRRRRDGLHAPNRVAWFREWQIMRLFDTLIDNFDRNQGNILLDGEWKMWWIDHTRAFTIHRQIQEPEKLFVCERDLWDRLRQLDRFSVDEQLGDLLNKLQITALMKRRDKLVEHFQGLLAEKGEGRVLFAYGDPGPTGQETLGLPDADFDGLPDGTLE